MNLTNFKSILDLLKAFPDEQSCIDYLSSWRWQEGVVISPFDPESRVYKCKGNKYRCKNTKKYFNVKTGTIFEDTKIPLQKWFLALYIFSSHKKGISSHQLAKDITVTQKTAWFMLHRLRSMFNHPVFNTPLSGVVEVDESYIGAVAENIHEKKKVYNENGNMISNKIPVIGMKQRDGNVIARVLTEATQRKINPILLKTITAESVLYTDSSPIYTYMNAYYDHSWVNHSAKQWVNGMVHTNGIENFWSHLKRGLDGIYHWASMKHLQSYIDEYTLRFNTRDMETSQRFNVILGNMATRLTYKTLISK